MKRAYFPTIFTLLMLIPVLAFSQKPHKAQKKFFPKEMRKYKLYFGMPKAKLPAVFHSDTDLANGNNFRQVYQVQISSERIETVIYYLDNQKEIPLYELIIIMKEGQSNEALGRELFGAPNYEGKEWRLAKSKTGLDFEVAAWTFQNKLIIAAALPDSEWGPGFDQ